MEDTILLKAVEKVAELDCDIRWASIASHLAGAAAAAEEAASSASDDDGAAGGGGGDVFAALADAAEGAAADEEGDVFDMDGAVDRLHLAPAAPPARSQLGVPPCASCVLPLCGGQRVHCHEGSCVCIGARARCSCVPHATQAEHAVRPLAMCRLAAPSALGLMACSRLPLCTCRL